MKALPHNVARLYDLGVIDAQTQHVAGDAKLNLESARSVESTMPLLPDHELILLSRPGVEDKLVVGGCRMAMRKGRRLMRAYPEGVGLQPCKASFVGIKPSAILVFDSITEPTSSTKSNLQATGSFSDRSDAHKLALPNYRWHMDVDSINRPSSNSSSHKFYIYRTSRKT